MDYSSLAFLVSGVLVLSCGQTDRITEADDCYTDATTVGVITKAGHRQSPHKYCMSITDLPIKDLRKNGDFDN